MVFNGRFFEALCIKRNCVIRVCVGCHVFLGERKTVAALLYFFLIIMKSLQLRGRRQIAEPRKYCLVRVIVFSFPCVFSIFCFSQVGILVKFPTFIVSIGLGLR